MKRLLIALFITALLVVGCAGVRIESDPPDALILHSRTGMPPWQPYGGKEKPLLTPATLHYLDRGVYFFRVTKQGYFSTLPQLAEVYPLHKETLHFTLAKTPELLEKEYLARGYIRLGDKWIDPEKAGLVKYRGRWMKSAEKFTEMQRARGLVLYAGKWTTPAERDVAVAADQRKKGLVPFKGRWITLAERTAEQDVDNHVEEAFSKPHREISPASVIGTIPQDAARVRLLNGTGAPVIFYLSGAESQGVPLDAYESKNIDLLPEQYRVAVISAGGETQPACRIQVFQPGHRYSLIEEGEPLKVTSDRILTPEEIKKKFDIPELAIPDTSTTGTKQRGMPERNRRKGRLSPPRRIRR